MMECGNEMERSMQKKAETGKEKEKEKERVAV